ncbi:hypothetical protein [Bradyrhizobium elkanii]|uniref:hypothetical protein n=1 Tax=Bradyrhizobium elkanii TaxID=29448 RepID=UPI0004B2B774|nr:hypothetical protein [Bradyrhizobium elkanii]WLA79544.1 hypothetical protein QNJ99_29605 [Bradyrhizobium elkanii]
MTDVVKVQIPLITNDPHKHALVYANDRKCIVQQPLSDTTIKLLGDDRKAFFEAEFRRGKWLIGRRVQDMDW